MPKTAKKRIRATGARVGRPPTRTYKPQERRQIPVALTQENVTRLDRMAARQKISRSALLRRLLDV